MRAFALAFAAVVAGCVVESTPVIDRYADPPIAVEGDADGAAWLVSDATIDLTPGVSVGYYVTYESGGRWHVRWTCDSYASGLGCAFDGKVTATDGDPLTDLQPYQLESSDGVWLVDDAATAVGYSALATTAVDGFDFQSPAGAKITFDLLVDGYRYWQFVFFPSGDPNLPGDAFGASPYGLPVTLLPTTP
jgi:hypothetical protein